MRFSTSLLLAVPIASVAAEGMIDQYKAQFQNFLGSFGATPPSAPAAQEAVVDGDFAASPDSEPAAVPASSDAAVTQLTLDTWKDTLYEPVQPGATTPEEWWVLMTGGNKTCLGHCGKADTAFKQAAANFEARTDVDTPRMAVIDCEQEGVLCNSLGGGAGSIWAFEMLPRPAPIDIYIARVNLSSITSATVENLLLPENKPAFQKLDSIFHPFDSPLAQYNVLVPFGYVLYYLSFIPNWAFMFVISAVSRQIMSRRMANHGNRNAAAAAAAPAPAQ